MAVENESSSVKKPVTRARTTTGTGAKSATGTKTATATKSARATRSTSTVRPSTRATNSTASTSASTNRAREKAKQRLNSLSSGDLSRGLGVKDKAEVLKTQELETKKETVKNTATKQTKQTKKTTQAKSSTPAKSKDKKANLGKIVVDQNAIEQMATATHEGKVRQKRLIIVSLSVLIAVAWIVILLSIIIKPKPPEHNCFMYLTGEAKSSCNLLLNGDNVDEWRTPEGISPQATYTKIKVDLKIKDAGVFDVRFRLEIYNDGVLVEDFGVVDTLSSYVKVTDGEGKTWYEQYSIEGKQTLLIMTGFTLMDTRTCPELTGITSDNVTIKLYVEVDGIVIPDIPDIPDYPDYPNIPGYPDYPFDPDDYPNIPGYPDYPYIPGYPDYPYLPNIPETSE